MYLSVRERGVTMHTHFMKCYGDFLKEHYSDLSKMNKSELCEAKEIACVMKEIFKADKEYNIVKAMEEHDDFSSVKMDWDEFVIRFRDYYSSADKDEKIKIKQEITGLLG